MTSIDYHLAYPIDKFSAEPPRFPACSSGIGRYFRVEGQNWLVCSDQSSNGPALLFLGPGVMRRVRQFPANWLALTDDALYALSWGA
jgi:hypothetical protein